MGLRIFYLLGILQGIIATGFAQLTSTDIERSYSAYHSLWKQAYLWPVLNQTHYSPGDTLYFKAYHVWDDYRLVKGRQIIEANLVNHEGDSQTKINFIIQDGLGFNQIVIPDSIADGLYRFTLHSSWSKNFDPSQIGSTVVTISRKLSIRERLKVAAAAEGGCLVAGVQNRVIIRGNPNSRFILKTKNHESVTTTQLNALGWAELKFIPEVGQTYVIQADTAQELFQLPDVQPDGIIVNVNTEKNELAISTSSFSAYKNQQLFLTYLQAGKILAIKSITIDHEQLFLDLPIATQEGTVTLSVLNSKGELLSTRAYAPPVKSCDVKLTLAEDSLLTRSRITARINVTDRKGVSRLAEFTFRAYNGNLTINQQASYPQLPFNQNEQESNVDYQLILNTRPLPWPIILNGNYTKPPFIMLSHLERRGKLLSNNRNVSENTQVLIYLQQSQYFYQTTTGPQGAISLVLPDIFGEDEFFYIAKSPSGDLLTDLTIEWESDTIQLPAAPASIKSLESNSFNEFNRHSKIIHRSYQSFVENKKMEPSNLSNPWRLAAPDVTINIQDYVLFKNMEDLIKEVIPAIYHRKRKDIDIIRVKLQAPMPVASSDPLYVINGVVTNDSKLFMNLNVEDLITISIITQPKKLIPLGLLGKNGIVLVTTRKAVNKQSISGHNRLIALNKSLPFTSLSAQSSIPQFRSTVYWKPITITNSSGESVIDFYTSDDPGPLLLTVEGITDDGQQFYHEKVVEIRQR